MFHKKTKTLLIERLNALISENKIKVIMLDEMQHLYKSKTHKTILDTCKDNDIEEA